MATPLRSSVVYYPPLSPVKVDAAAADDRARLVDVVDLDDAVEVADPPGAPAGPQPAPAQQVQVQQAAQPQAAVLGHHLRFVLDEVCKNRVADQELIMSL